MSTGRFNEVSVTVSQVTTLPARAKMGIRPRRAETRALIGEGIVFISVLLDEFLFKRVLSGTISKRTS